MQAPPNRLRELREARGIKLVQIAALVDRDQSVVFQYENGKVGVPDRAKLILADFYDVNVEYLMGWDQSSPDNDLEAAAS